MYQKEEEGWLKHWDFLLLDILCMQVAVTLVFLFLGPLIYLQSFEPIFFVQTRMGMNGNYR